jgi:hypothetical protein
MRRPAPRRSAWSIALGGTRDERFAVARDAGSTADDLAAVAPGYQDPDPDLELIAAILDHPAVPDGVVSRYATCHDEAVRVRVARHQGCPGTSLDVLAVDPSPAVRRAVQERMRLVGGSVHGCSPERC